MIREVSHVCPGIGLNVGICISKMLKFYVKVFYVMVKALFGELCCPCDRSCLVYHIDTDTGTYILPIRNVGHETMK